MALARRRSRTGSGVALTALSVGPNRPQKQGIGEKNEKDHFRSRCCLPPVVWCRFRPTGDDHDADQALDDDEPRHGRHDRKVLDDHRGPDLDRHEDDEEDAQEGHEEERRHEEHQDEDRAGNCRLDSRSPPRHEVTLKNSFELQKAPDLRGFFLLRSLTRSDASRLRGNSSARKPSGPSGRGAAPPHGPSATPRKPRPAHLMIIFVSYGTTSCWNKRCNGEK